MKTFTKNTLFNLILTFSIGYFFCMFIDGDIYLRDETRKTLALTIIILNAVLVFIRVILYDIEIR